MTCCRDQRSVAITWQTSVDQLGEPARRLLHRLAWFEAKPIPESLLEVSVPDLDAAENDPVGALAELKAYSLVFRAADTPSFSVHRLVQEVTRKSLDDDPAHRVLAEALRWMSAAFVGDPQDTRDWSVLDPLESHVRAVAARADAAGIAEPTAAMMNAAGELLFAKGLYAEAEPLFKRALAIREKALGPEHPGVAESLTWLAMIDFNRRAYAEAEPLLVRALAIREKALGPEHTDVAQSLNNLGTLYSNLGAWDEVAYAKAEPLFERALAIREKALGPEHPNLAISLDGLARIYETKGVLNAFDPDGYKEWSGAMAKAESLLQRAVTIRENAQGREHASLAVSLHNLGFFYYNRRVYAKAEPLYKRALAIREKALGPEHPAVAETLVNLAEVYRLQEDYAKAEPLLRRAASLRIRKLGKEHPDSLAVVSAYASVLVMMGKTADEQDEALRSAEYEG